MMIECFTLEDKKKEVPVESLTFRPAAYGIIVHENKLLLVKTKTTGKWFLPGGAIELGEKAAQTVARETQEEAGIKIKVVKFFRFYESYFYVEPWDKAFHCHSFIYYGEPLTFEVNDSNPDKGDEATQPQWVSLDDLKPDDFQGIAGEIFSDFIATNPKHD